MTATGLRDALGTRAPKRSCDQLSLPLAVALLGACLGVGVLASFSTAAFAEEAETAAPVSTPTPDATDSDTPEKAAAGAPDAASEQPASGGQGAAAMPGESPAETEEEPPPAKETPPPAPPRASGPPGEPKTIAPPSAGPPKAAAKASPGAAAKEAGSGAKPGGEPKARVGTETGTPKAPEGAKPAASGEPPAAGAGAAVPEEGRQVFLPRSEKFKNQRVDIAPGDIEVLEFIRFLADYTGLPVIVDSTNQQALKGTITIAARMKDVTGDVVQAILQTNKWLVTREQLASGEIILKVESTAAAMQAAGAGEPAATPLIIYDQDKPRLVSTEMPELEAVKPDEIATMVFTLKYTRPTDAITSLNNLIGGIKGVKSKAFSIVEVQNSPVVIITAKFGLLPFLVELLKLIDVPTKQDERIVQIIDVENADAEELAELIRSFLQGRSGMGGAGGRLAGRLPSAPIAQPGGAAQPAAGGRSSTEIQTNLIADWRTQKIIVETYSERELEDIHMLVRELDTRFDIRRLKTRIYQVRYLKAEEVAADLQSLLGSGYGPSGRAGMGTRTGATGAASRTSRSRGVSRVGRSATTGAATPAPMPGAAGGGGQNAPIPALIVPHQQTNSLIIQAEPEEYAEIMNILDQIDIKRRQVFLEAALVEVTTGSKLNYTIELLAGEPNDTGTRALFESSFGLAGLDFANWNRLIPDTLEAGSVPAGGLVAIMNRGKFPVLVQFFKSNTDSQVLATPFIIADDNQSNIIDVLETRYVSNTQTGASGITTASQEGEDAGITLEITPTISSRSAVFLEMSFEVSQFAGEGTAQVLPPKTTNTINSAVSIPDGEIFVIGGLTREAKSKAISKVPILGDIPLLGKLFRSETTSRAASNLYIFLRAHVLTHPDFADGIELTQQADHFVREFAPDLEYVRFQKPTVKTPPPPPADRDAPMRLRRSKYSEGFEAPQGPYENEWDRPADEREQRPSYRDDLESPHSGAAETTPTPSPAKEKDSRPVPRKVGRTPRAGQTSAATEPPGGLTRPPSSPGGLAKPQPEDLPPLEPEPEAEPAKPKATERKSEEPVELPEPAEAGSALDDLGLEVDPAGESWLVPIRAKGTRETTRSSPQQPLPEKASSSESWLGVEKE